jgi:hypothetical protein
LSIVPFARSWPRVRRGLRILLLCEKAAYEEGRMSKTNVATSRRSVQKTA